MKFYVYKVNVFIDGESQIHKVRYTLAFTYAWMTTLDIQNMRCAIMYTNMLLGARKNVYKDFKFLKPCVVLQLESESSQFKTHWALSQALGSNLISRLLETFGWNYRNAVINISEWGCPLIMTKCWSWSSQIEVKIENEASQVEMPCLKK